MDRDYRSIALNYNRILEEEEDNHNMTEQSGSDAPATVPGAGAGAAGGRPQHRHDQNTWNYSHTSEDYNISHQLPAFQEPTVQASVLQTPAFQLAPLQEHTFQMSRVQTQQHNAQPSTIRKRSKPFSYSSASYQDADSEGSRSVRTLPRYKKQTHNEIEKRRRDKMNAYISQLSSMVPIAQAQPQAGEGAARRQDKISVLKAVVHYLRGVRGSMPAFQEPTVQASVLQTPAFQLAPLQEHTFQMSRVQTPAFQLAPLQEHTFQMSRVQTQQHNAQPSTIRKRSKPFSYSSASYQDADSEGSRSVRTLPRYKKQTHNEIEKRRRDKMNAYISQLSSMVPIAQAQPQAGEGAARRQDKISVLKAVVHYLRGVRGSMAGPAGAGGLTPAPSHNYLTEDELNSLVVDAARDGDAVLIVVGCDRGRLLYVSTNVQKMLHYHQSELVGQSMFDLLHPKDVAMFKDQLSPSALTSRHDPKLQGDVSGGGASRFCSGARRAFFCRIRCKAASSSSGEMQVLNDNTHSLKKSQKKYRIIQFTGYLKTWSQDETSEMDRGVMGEGEEEVNVGDLSCLVAVGRALSDLVELTPAPAGPAPASEEQPPPPALRPVQYMSRHAVDGTFVFADPRVTIAVGYLPQELVGTSLYRHVAPSHRDTISQAHKQALLKREKLLTQPYMFKRKDGTSVWLQSHVKPFRNPWTKEEEHIVANNTVVGEPPVPAGGGGGGKEGGCGGDRTTHVKASVVSVAGVDVADTSQVLEEVSGQVSTPGTLMLTDLVQGASLNEQARSRADVDTSWYHVRKDVLLGSAGGEGVDVGGEGACVGGERADVGGELDGNDEAAMSVIMSLLEADAGLGGPVNISGLPWPLP